MQRWNNIVKWVREQRHVEEAEEAEEEENSVYIYTTRKLYGFKENDTI